MIAVWNKKKDSRDSFEQDGKSKNNANRQEMLI